MKFALDPLEQGYVIKAYEPGWIQVNEEKYSSSLLLMPNQLITDWPVTDLELLEHEHIVALADYAPQVLLIGTGRQQKFVHPQIFSPLMKQGIGFEVMATAAACRTYNVLLSEGRKVLAALIP